MKHMFEDEGFFCPRGNLTLCDEEVQSAKLTNAFSLSVSLMPVSAVVFGVMIDRFGLFKIRLLLHGLMIVGFCFMMAARPGETDAFIRELASGHSVD